jgi:hypothetical protein
VAVLISQTRFAAPGTALAGVILGGLVGGAIAAGGGFVFNLGDCGAGSTTGMQQVTRQGTLDPGATVVLDFSCGTLDLAMEPGAAWRLDATYRGDEPTVTASASRLELTSPGDGVRRHEWSLVVPRENVGALEIAVNAASGVIHLGGASLPRLLVHANAGDVRVIASDTTIGRLDASVNAGRLRLDLDGPVDGTLSANAGSIDVCVPADAELQITVREQLTFGTNLDQRSLTRSGNLWQRAGSGPLIRLDVSGSAAGFNLDPSGGCR